MRTILVLGVLALMQPAMTLRSPAFKHNAPWPVVYSSVAVGRSLAREAWPDANPLGRTFRIRFSTDRSRPGFGPFTVVGVVEDTRESVVDATPPQFYTAFNQQPLASNAFLHIRTANAPLDLLPSVGRVVRESDPDLPLDQAATFEALIDREGVRPRFLARVLATFAALALAISVMGLYAVSAWIAEQREREAALRVALGATRQAVTLLLITRGLSGLSLGVTIGWLAAWPLSLRLVSELHGVAASDLTTRVLVAFVLGGVCTIALWRLAWHASGNTLSAILRAE